MTREEAIKRLKEARNTIQPFRYVDEAIDYALKALAQKPCEDAVSRQALLEFFKDDDYVVNEINNMPSVIPKREQGEWIGVNPMVDTLMCSKCGENIISEEFKSNYCPNCGADMRGEENGR